MYSARERSHAGGEALVQCLVEVGVKLAGNLAGCQAVHVVGIIGVVRLGLRLGRGPFAP